MSLIDKERKFLVATPDGEDVAKMIKSHVDRAQTFFANGHHEARQKLDNDLFHVILITSESTKSHSIDFVRKVIKEHKKTKIAFIINMPVPDENLFVDEAVIGQVQFWSSREDDEALAKCLFRALNFVSSDSEAKFQLKFLAPGDQLIREGEKEKNVFLVRKGNLRASTTTKNGQLKILGNIIAGEFVGEMAYINDEKRSADVFAFSDCELIELPAKYVDQILFSKPSWSKALIKTLSKRLQRSNAGKVTNNED